VTLRRATLGAALACLAAGGCLSSPGQGGGDGGPDGDGDSGAGRDAGVSEACGTTRALRDDFEAEVLDGSRWYAEQSNMDAGNVEIWATPETFGVLASEGQYRVAGGDLQVELGFDAYDDASRITLWMRGQGSSLGIQLQDGLLRLVRDDGNGAAFPDSAAFEPSWTWWRLWEVDGRVHWGVSHDGTEWEDLGDVAWGQELVAVEIWLEGETAESTLDVASVNQRAAEEPYCPASSFTDEFDGLDRWSQRLDPPCVIASDGALAFSTAEEASCTVVSRERLDLRGSAVAVEMTLAGDCGPTPIVSLAHRDGYTDIVCMDDGDGVVLRSYSEGGDGAAIDYDPAQHRYLRLRHDRDQGAILWETHADGDGDWQQFDVLQVDEDAITAVEVRLSIDGAPTADAANGAVFDKLNLAPE
jgi:hypothetical protein